MALPINPKPGFLLRCDYQMHASPQPPEMLKNRPVVVIAQRSPELCVVVPLSTSEPVPIYTFHHEMDVSKFPEHLRNRCWAKCDMISTVAYWRLNRYYKQDQYGKRKYIEYRVASEDLAAIRKGIVIALGLGIDADDP